ncbi:ogr/Delta-like zinc finger family protein [Acinetobacter nectaris]|uniref:ogr/Delta-like zinc finger family protein n=2 Tax=Acinetobacter nectaris TaxID=1219382 RepID=UPI001F311654|nr:ogr/Delta-like zinc finger family protein [Acinetobacter nectaris]MCF9027879.1 ogr/Delta-like zinc finger family protein [Acinetobacter nectaris]
MMKCPICKHAAHTRTSRYITDTIKEIYYQCQNVECSATFKAIESLDRIISQPVFIPKTPHKTKQNV